VSQYESASRNRQKLEVLYQSSLGYVVRDLCKDLADSKINHRVFSKRLREIANRHGIDESRLREFGRWIQSPAPKQIVLYYTIDNITLIHSPAQYEVMPENAIIIGMITSRGAVLNMPEQIDEKTKDKFLAEVQKLLIQMKILYWSAQTLEAYGAINFEHDKIREIEKNWLSPLQDLIVETVNSIGQATGVS
jgi:hypothetical protein